MWLMAHTKSHKWDWDRMQIVRSIFGCTNLQTDYKHMANQFSRVKRSLACGTGSNCPKCHTKHLRNKLVHRISHRCAAATRHAHKRRSQLCVCEPPDLRIALLYVSSSFLTTSFGCFSYSSANIKIVIFSTFSHLISLTIYDIPTVFQGTYLFS